MTQPLKADLNAAATCWPDKDARHGYEAAMLDFWAGEIYSRYPEEVWPLGERGGPVDQSAGGPKSIQAAFVAGVRFACATMRSAAADLRDSLPPVDDEAAVAS